jgi:hypothetical protein
MIDDLEASVRDLDSDGILRDAVLMDSKLNSVSTMGGTKDARRKMMNFASVVAREGTFLVAPGIEDDTPNTEQVHKRVLFILRDDTGYPAIKMDAVSCPDDQVAGVSSSQAPL